MTATILGIVNITEDSFSDGGRFLAPDAAIAHARALAKDGADILDLGAASSNPDAKPVASDVEIARLAPVVEALKRDGLVLSIDSFSTEVQRWALAQGVDYLNDIQGFADEEFYPELAAASAKLIVMHSVQGRGPAARIDVAPETIFDRVVQFFEKRIGAIERAGVSRERMILDPGMGTFLGIRADASFTVLRRLPELKKTFDLPVLISVSRKAFLRRFIGRTAGESGATTLAAELYAVRQGTNYIRTHDSAALKDALRVLLALGGNKA